ncbi:hypothetical protein ACFSW6_16500 [Comamonas terrae]|uniref:Uncharacterized protein n=2 Tax=Comamonas terrae TaxID=673548 RepID=A0ABW5UR30_9BURK
MNPGAERSARVRGAVTRHLSNAVATWQGGEPFGVIFTRVDGKEWMPGAPISAERCTVSLSVLLCHGIEEGVEGLSINGIAYCIASPVLPDSSGWAKFDVVEA